MLESICGAGSGWSVMGLSVRADGSVGGGVGRGADWDVASVLMSVGASISVVVDEDDGEVVQATMVNKRVRTMIATMVFMTDKRICLMVGSPD